MSWRRVGPGRIERVLKRNRIHGLLECVQERDIGLREMNLYFCSHPWFGCYSSWFLVQGSLGSCNLRMKGKVCVRHWLSLIILHDAELPTPHDSQRQKHLCCKEATLRPPDRAIIGTLGFWGPMPQGEESWSLTNTRLDLLWWCLH